MKTEVVDTLSVQLLRDNPDKIYVFGDNTLRKGKAGQAIIRDEPNAFGVATKLFPSMKEGSFLPDGYDGIKIVRNDLERLYRESEGRTVVFPSAGIGTGMSRMKEECPEVLKWMNNVLRLYFNFDNERGEVL